MTVESQDIEPVSSEAWKSKFISLINYFESTVSLTKSVSESVSAGPPSVMQSPELAAYKREDLAAARHHYNNAHLISFWKWFNSKLDDMVEAGEIDAAFPVFSLGKGLFPGTVMIKPYQLDYFQNFVYQKVTDKHYSYRHYSRSDGEKYAINTSDAYEQLIGQLHYLNEMMRETTIIFYKKFILEQKQGATSCWDDYRIHEFLDRYLYVTPEGQICSAAFEGVFFSNNLNELEVYLNYCKTNKFFPDLSDISDFLDRQRKHYLTLAIEIGIEENAFLNNARHFLYYDPNKKVVVMPKLDAQRRKYIHNELVVKTGVVRVDGCPFARSKGVTKNAIIEVYARFDSMMLALIERWILQAKQQ